MRLPIVPAAYFGTVLGLAGLGTAWRQAGLLWGLPPEIGEVLMGLATLEWFTLIVLFALKWQFAREAAMAEVVDPVQCCFIGLAGVSTMLIAGAVLPYQHALAVVLFVAGAAWTLLFAGWRTSRLWRGGRDPATSTAVLYLPAVAGSFVMAGVASALGEAEWGQLAFGAGLFSWFAIESVLLHRLYTSPEMPPALRPTLGVQMAPAPVAAFAYCMVTGGGADVIGHALLGYGLLQVVVMLFALGWLRAVGASMGFWAFSFGGTAIASVSILMARRGAGPAVDALAPVLFAGANLLILVLVVMTGLIAARGKLVPAWHESPARAHT